MADAPQFSEETKEIVKRCIWMESRKLAVTVKAIYEAFGDEGMNVLKKAMTEFGRQKGAEIRDEKGLKAEDCDVEVTLSQIYPEAHKHFAPAGLDMERVEFTPTRSESKVHSCSQLNAWKDVWDESWRMCEIYAKCQDEGFMEGVNPKLKWHKHVLKDGSKCLAHGDAHPCVIGLELTK